VRVERNDDDGAGNRVTAGSEGNLNRAAEAVARTPRESSAPKKPRAPRKPKVAVENDDNVGNR
jgi:hypothetical protein